MVVEVLVVVDEDVTMVVTVVVVVVVLVADAVCHRQSRLVLWSRMNE